MLAGLGWPQLGCLICSIGPSLCRTLGQAVHLVATQPSEKKRERERERMEWPTFTSTTFYWPKQGRRRRQEGK